MIGLGINVFGYAWMFGWIGSSNTSKQDVHEVYFKDDLICMCMYCMLFGIER